jgi:hypothetical protein
MTQRIQRFKLCDLRFHPYLKRVIERLPEDVREIVLNDMSFQILTDDGIGSLPSNDLSMINRELETDPTFKDIVSLKKLDVVGNHSIGASESLSTRKSILAGILTAVKEANL